MLPSLEWIGFLAGACTTLSFVPQVIRIWKRRSTEDISLGMYLLFFVGVVLWIFYGLLNAALPVIFANALSLLLIFAVLAMKFLFKKR